ncbi:MAG: DUF45 domain-containing protein [Bacillota bacterium]|nr:DUF45 domain-containing protein [Bacillota bacterium]
MLRTVADISYELTYKKVKNINLRIRSDLTIAVSANKHVPFYIIDEFVLSKTDWIKAAQARISTKIKEEIPFEDKWTNEECLNLFSEISDRIYPIFKNTLKTKPVLKVRIMKSRWGVCHYSKNYILLNKKLMAKPYKAIEYVIMHEYVHFLHHNHQKSFHDTMKSLMPDYKERSKLLK